MAKKKGVEFRLFAPYNEEVALLGDWNKWERIPMKKGKDGWWRVEVPLEDGEYQYRFGLKSKSKFMEGEWVEIADPRAPQLTMTTFENAFIQIKDGQQVVHSHQWKHDGVSLCENDELVIYEMHIGDFTGGVGDERDNPGTFRAALDKLDYLKELGINAVELMPVNEFPFERSWGYNPRSLWAIENTYGTPTDFAQFVDECHARGIRVIMDAVFNHMESEAPLTRIDYTYWFHEQPPHPPDQVYGPDFNYEFWDENLKIHPARQEVHDAVRYWMTEFHIDGVRFDATYLISNYDVLHYLQSAIFNEAKEQGKPFYTIAENLPQDPSIASADGPLDSAWHENLYHQLNATMLVQDRHGKQPFDVDTLINVLDPRRDGFGGSFNVVNYFDNHDKDRTMWELGAVSHIFDAAAFRRMKLGFGLLLTAPGQPMIWMGDEFGEAAPKTLDWQRLDWALMQNESNADLHRYVRGLINLRTSTPALISNSFEVVGVDQDRGILAFKRWTEEGSLVVVVANLKDEYAGNFTFGWPDNGRWHEHVYNYDVTVENNTLTDSLAESEVKIYICQ